MDDGVLKAIKQVKLVYWLVGIALLFLGTSIIFVVLAVSPRENPSLAQMSRQIFLFLLVFAPVWSAFTQYFFRGYVGGTIAGKNRPVLDRLQSGLIFRLVMLVPLAVCGISGLMFAYLSGATGNSPHLWFSILPFIGVLGFMWRSYPSESYFSCHLKQVGI